MIFSLFSPDLEPFVRLEPKTESHDNQNVTPNHFSTICKQTLSLQLRQETTHTHEKKKKKLYMYLFLSGQSSKTIITYILDVTILVIRKITKEYN